MFVKVTRLRVGEQGFGEVRASRLPRSLLPEVSRPHCV